jgi:hypothetical protein
MLERAKLIRTSVDFLAVLIEAKLLEIETAENEHKENHIIESLKNEAFQLLGKLNRERANMDEYMEYYRKFVADEKKALLSFIGEKESFSLWGIPPNEGRQIESATPSGKA